MFRLRAGLRRGRGAGGLRRDGGGLRIPAIENFFECEKCQPRRLLLALLLQRFELIDQAFEAAAADLPEGGVAGVETEDLVRKGNLPGVAAAQIGFADRVLLTKTEGLGADTLATLRIFSDIAVGLLLFELGQRVDLGWLRRNPWLFVTSVLEALLQEREEGR